MSVVREAVHASYDPGAVTWQLRMAFAAAVVLAVTGCGYRLAGSGVAPEGARTIHVQTFRNNTNEYGLGVLLRRAVEEEFRRRGPLEVVSGRDADLVLSGVIRGYANAPVATTAVGTAVQFQGVMRVGMRLTERATGRIVYENPALLEAQEFGGESGIIVTTLPSFQRGTMDARDLVSLTNIQVSEVGRRRATNDLVQQVARDIYQQAMEGF